MWLETETYKSDDPENWRVVWLRDPYGFEGWVIIDGRGALAVTGTTQVLYSTEAAALHDLADYQKQPGLRDVRS